MGRNNSLSLNPAWPHILGQLVILVAALIGLLRYAVSDGVDSMHCSALLNKGSWLDQERFTWQPDGCILHNYNAREGQQCFGTRQISFIGDSTTRKLFYQTAHILDSKLPTVPSNDNQKHTNIDLQTEYGTTLSFIWDPFLNSSHVHKLVSYEGDAATRPALLVMGSGLWYMRYSNTSGGLQAWESNVERVLHSISEAKTKPADSIVILPVEQLVTAKLSPERAMTMRSSDIDAMNSDLLHRINPPAPGLFHTIAPNSPVLPVAFPLVFNQMLEVSMTEDGLHYADPLVKAQASILLNMRCNNYLPKTFPFDKTCCNQYPAPFLTHFIVLIVAILWGPWLYFISSNTGNHSSYFTFIRSEDAAPVLLSASVALIYVADRTGLWLKEQKKFDAWTFGFLCLASLFIGLVTLRRSDKDLGFLNRDQTDEWKGWMQIIILIYHYLGASRISGIYNPVRVLVSSYLFMTGFGHTTYYLRKADFGFLRVAQVMVRLNLLTLLLAYTMNTNYISYYFAPLVSWWYIIIYATMAIASRFNDRTLFVLCKTLVSAILIAAFVHEPRILETLFSLLERLCNIRWSAHEWTFRVSLDLWIVYAGMLCALAVQKFHALRLSDDPRWQLTMRVAIGLSAMTLVWFFVFELSQDSKFAYNAWHPYVSFIPVLAFCILRNATAVLRSVHSRAFAFIGKCSLETFIIQYHIWLAGDTKGVLLIVPGTRWRPLNFIITTFVFIYLSDRLAHATTYITTQICGGGSKPLPTSVANTPRDDVQFRAEPRSVHTTESSEPSKENSLPSSISRGREHVSRFIPSRIGSFIEKYYSSVEARLLLIIFIMWILNLMWTYTS
ncbi:hypothetical protein AX17_000205 [Amanita inopinata Kibby_2008]|nr:hypothetical protein AX17_000205 [Amanita inopinata Kibby_2008]